MRLGKAKRYIARSLLSVILLVFASSCLRVDPKIEPQIQVEASTSTLRQKPSAFKPLNDEEVNTDWGKELYIGTHFAKEGDLYRAITAFKRAEILVPSDNPRKVEIEYEIVLAYYLGKKYEDALIAYQNSDLSQTGSEFTAKSDLLIMLIDIYRQLKRPEEAEKAFEELEVINPQKAQEVRLSDALYQAQLDKVYALVERSSSSTAIVEPLKRYESQQKSISKAQGLNAVLPGAGYWYVDQKATAVSAFLLNTLFIAAACEFFSHGNTVAGIITTSIELGWYIGGIYGAGLAAREYNERMYDKTAKRIIEHEKLAPTLMLQYNF